MKWIIFLIFISAMASQSCNKPEVAEGTPKCVENKIVEFENIACAEAAIVKEYTFQEETVYTFDPGLCGADMTTEVVDCDCNNLGYLGGLIGNVQINGEDFSNADFVKTIWSN
jgi:hypothetical protein